MQQKNQRILAGITFVLLLSSIAFASIPSTKAELTEQKGINIIQNVAGLDVKQYTVLAKEALSSQQPLYAGVVQQDIMFYNLTSAQSRTDALCSFINGSLQALYITQTQGRPLLTATGNLSAIEVAKNFLGSYQTYTGQPLFGQLKETLNNRNITANVNSVQTIGDKVLQVNVSNGFSNFKWYYSVNGISAPYAKFISVSVNNSVINSFVDNWNFNSIGSTQVSISKEQAAKIALTAARNHNWSLPIDASTLDAKNFNMVNSLSWSLLTFDNSLNASLPRSSNALQLYPSWHIGLVLNKWYGQLYGIEVDVWADTGQVRSVEEEYSTMPEPENLSSSAVSLPAVTSQASPNLPLLVVLPTVATTTIVIAYIMTSKNEIQTLNLLKKRSTKATIFILCFLMCSTVILDAVSPVAAATRGAAIFGAQSSGAINSPQSLSWRKTDTEIFYQWSISLSAQSFFENNGYYAVDREGSASTHDQILYDLNCNYGTASGFDYFAVVDFDHGVGNDIVTNEMHYMFEDDVGTEWGTYQQFYSDPASHTHINEGVYDRDVYNVVNPNKVIFAFINTCMSADYNNGHGMIPSNDNYPSYTQGMLPSGNARSMPFAFTHRWVESISTSGFNVLHDQNPDWRNFNDYGDISNDGYSNPDTGSNVYLGFPWGSAALEQHIPFETNGPVYMYFLQDFFYLALYYDISVNQALDIASDWTWGSGNFYFSPLHQGFRACWPEIDSNGVWQNNYGYGSTLAVYGNGNIHLQQYGEPSRHDVTVLAYDESSGSYVTGIPIWVDGSCVSSGSTISVAPGDYIFQAADSDSGGAFNCFYDGTNYYGNSADITSNEAGTITVYYNYIPTYCVTVSAVNPQSLQCITTNVYADGQWVGATSDNTAATFYLPLGWHDIEGDQWAWDDSYGAYDMLIGGFGTATIAGDTQITMQYY